MSFILRNILTLSLQSRLLLKPQVCNKIVIKILKLLTKKLISLISKERGKERDEELNVIFTLTALCHNA